MGHEEEIGTNNFSLVEFDLFLRISNMELQTNYINFHQYLLHHYYYDLFVHLTSNHEQLMSNC